MTGRGAKENDSVRFRPGVAVSAPIRGWAEPISLDLLPNVWDLDVQISVTKP